MSFDSYETSISEGQPIALYEFSYGNTIWRYCTDDVDRVVNGEVWSAFAISDEGVVQGGSDQNDFQVLTQSNHPVAELFRHSRPSGKVWLTVRRWHVGDPDGETPLMWSGTVVNATMQDKATVQLSCRSLGGSYDRQGLRLAWGRSCPHVLYAPFGCKVDKSLHAYVKTVTEVTGSSFTVDTYSLPAEGSFIGGFAEVVRPDGSFQRYALESVPVGMVYSFTVLGTTEGLAVGDTITLYPGCARVTSACKKFNNLPNYGGFPHLPGKSPFDGTPVF